MFQILIAGTNPSTQVGVNNLKTGIFSTKLVQLQYNIVEPCDMIMTNYKMITERGGRHDNVVLDLYNN